MNTTQELMYVDRPEGRIAVEVSGSGPLVVLVPGMGDLRGTYRYLAPALAGAGYRVASTDLRGHGDSSLFPAYGDEETASDVVAVIEQLGGPAVVIGNSMGAAAAVIVAADRPELVSGVVMLGPVVRDHTSAVQQVLARILFQPLWVAAAWKAALPMFYKGRKPADHAEYLASIKASLKRPGYGAAFSQLALTLTHAPAERRLGAVQAPALILIGDQDPDSPDPAAEGAWIAEQVHGESVLVEDCGHYPQSQRPDVVNPAVITFLGTVTGA